MGRLHILFEIKRMRAMFWIPFILMILCFLYFISVTSNERLDLILALPTFEFVIVPLSSWWIIYLFYDYYENTALEILLSYPITEFEHGFQRILFFSGLYTITTISFMGYISFYSDAKLYLLVLQYIPQYFFFAGLSFLSMTLFRNVGITITIIGFYTATEFLTAGQLIPWYHVFFHHENLLNFNDVFYKSMMTLIIGLVQIKLAGYVLKKGGVDSVF